MLSFGNFRVIVLAICADIILSLFETTTAYWHMPAVHKEHALVSSLA